MKNFLIFIAILAIGSISGIVTAQFVIGSDGDSLKNLLGGCIYGACKDTKITGNVNNGTLAGCVFAGCKNVEITGKSSSQPTPNTLQTATLTVTKEVVCSASSACPKPEDFTIKITGNDPSPSTVNDDGTGTKVTIGSGEFAVTEAPTDGFRISFSGDCDGKISAGETKKCTVTNTQTAKLVVSKVIDLSEVGFCSPAAVGCKPGDYSITVTGNNPQPSSFQGSETGTEVILDPGQYKVTEAFLSPNDRVSFSGDCQQDSAGSLSASGNINGGETKNCKITNKFVLP